MVLTTQFCDVEQRMRGFGGTRPLDLSSNCEGARARPTLSPSSSGGPGGGSRDVRLNPDQVMRLE